MPSALEAAWSRSYSADLEVAFEDGRMPDRLGELGQNVLFQQFSGFHQRLTHHLLVGGDADARVSPIP